MLFRCCCWPVVSQWQTQYCNSSEVFSIIVTCRDCQSVFGWRDSFTVCLGYAQVAFVIRRVCQRTVPVARFPLNTLLSPRVFGNCSCIDVPFLPSAFGGGGGQWRPKFSVSRVGVQSQVVIRGFVVGTILGIRDVWQRVMKQRFEEIHGMLAVSLPVCGFVWRVVFKTAWVVRRSHVEVQKTFQV